MRTSQNDLPSTDYALLAALGGKRLPQAIDSFVDLVDIGVGDLKRLCIAVDGSDGLLDDLAAGFEARQRALNLFGKGPELVQVRIQHLHLCTLLRISGVPRGDHGCSIGAGDKGG